MPTTKKCKVVGDLEGAFTNSSQMDDYVACIVPNIELWIDTVKPDTEHPRGYYFVPHGRTATDGACKYDDQTLAYCPSSERVYLGELAVWMQYTKHGDASVA